jgi:RNA polymerase sigma-70 factor (ECF subfamily)
MPVYTDEELISRTLNRDDRNAFGELVMRYQSNIRALLRKLTGGDTALADDLAQDTFIKAFQRLRGFEQRSRFSTWLYRIAYTTFIGNCRTNREKSDSSAIENSIFFSEKDHGDRVESKIDIDRAFVLLYKNERAALALHYGKDLSHEEAASVLGCAVGTLKTNILRGREKLRKKLEQLYKGSPDAIR